MKKVLFGLILAVGIIALAPAAGKKAYAYSSYCPSCGSTNISDYGTDYSEYSSSKHAVIRKYECYNCWYEWTDTESYENHNWYERYHDDYEKFSSTQHSRNVYYRCEDCGAEKTVVQKGNHKWQHREYDDDNYKYISPSRHEVRRHYYCEDCYAEKTKTVEEKHDYDEYDDVCYKCTYPKKDRTLKSGKWTYYSGRPWLKITVKRDGYLEAKGYYGSLDLYKKTKKKYLSADFYNGILPVKKGTYYLRPYSWSSSNSKLKVTCRAVTNQHNYTKRKAATVPANKYKMVTIYAKDKKKTWDRWYKIKITKNKRIFVWGDIGYLMDSKGNYYTDFLYYGEDKYGNSKHISDVKLKKGTYYFSVGTSWNWLERKRDTGTWYRFKWKYR